MLKPTFLALVLGFLFLQEVPAQTLSLDYYLEQGLKNSPLLKDYTNQVQSGRNDSLLVLCGYKPQVGITSQVLAAPASDHFGYDEAITNGGNYSALIGVKQSLINKNVRSAQLQSIELIQQSLNVNRKITETDLKKNITFQYITSYADYSQLQFIRKVIEMLTEQKKLMKYLVESGIYQQTDLMNLAVTIKAQEISRKLMIMQFKNDLALLNLFCGIVDTTTVELSKPEIRLINRFDISSSPVMLQSRIDSLKNSNSRTLVDLSYRPKLDAFADAGFLAIKPLNIPNNFGTSFGLNFSLPIYDGKQRFQQYKKLDIAENSRIIYRDFYTRQYRQQYNQLTEQLHLADELISDIKNQLSQQEELIDLYKTEIEKGLVRITDFMVIINNYSATQNSLSIAEMNRLQLINQLNHLK